MEHARVEEVWGYVHPSSPEKNLTATTCRLRKVTGLDRFCCIV